MKTTDHLVNLGYPTDEPSIYLLAYKYYVTFFPEAEAKEFADKYCEELEKKL